VAGVRPIGGRDVEPVLGRSHRDPGVEELGHNLYCL
jgi:hypothetical protein